MTPDWSAGPATVPYAHLENPQTLNLYSYVDNNPINGIDLDGHAISHAFDGLDASSTGDEGRPKSQAEILLAQMQSSAFGWQLEAQQAQQQSTTQGQNTDFVSVSDYPTGAGGFHHTGIAVDDDDTHGFSTADPQTPWWQRIFGAPKARMEDDLDMHTNKVTGEVAPHSYIHIPITAAQADKINAAIRARGNNAGRYNLLFNNCAQAVESFLHAGGVSGIPHGEIFVPAVLHGVLLLERAAQ